MNPIVLTRPAFAVTCACWTLYDIAAEAAEAPPGWVVRGYLGKLAARRYPSSPPGDGPKLLLNASIVPDTRYAAKFRELAAAARPFVATAGGRVSAAFIPARASAPRPLTSENITPWLLELKLPLLEEELFRTLDHQFEVAIILFSIYLLISGKLGGLRVGKDVILILCIIRRCIICIYLLHCVWSSYISSSQYG